MINILCYGDSNTFGWDAETSTRLGMDERWPGVVRKILGDNFNIIEEGLPGRTTVWYDPVMNLISGADYLFPCLSSHQPLDMVVFMLGSNDLKQMFAASPFDVFWGMERVLKIAYDFKSDSNPTAPKLFLISPPHICAPKNQFAEMFYDAEEKSQNIGKYYRQLSDKYDTLFCDASEITKPSKTDGLHIDEKNHKILGECIAKQIMEYFK